MKATMRPNKKNVMIQKQINMALMCVVLLAIVAPAFAQVSVPGFLSARAYPAGSNPVSAAVGDFNGDGRPDLVVANTGSPSVSILLGNGDGSFQAPLNFATGGSPTSVDVGDFDGDGNLDVAAANGSGISILLGNGDGTLQPAVAVQAGGGSFFVTVGDFNVDSVPDLVVVATNNVNVLLGNGDGTFQAPLNFFLQFTNGRVAVGDFNNDGVPDLAVQSQFAVTVLWGNGDGTFRMGQSNVGSSPGPMVVGDFNGDGILDLAVSYIARPSTPGYVTVYLGNGDGTFNNVGFFSPYGEQFLGAPVVADFNGDGNLDVAVKGFNGEAVSVLLGNGNGTLQLPVRPRTQSLSNVLVVGDFDSNGAPDLVELNGRGNSVNVLMNTGGNPPLLALLSLDPVIVVGGAASVGTVFLGGPAPAGGATIVLSSSDPSIASFPEGPTVTIPEGSNSATFSVMTSPVGAPTSSTISGSWNGVTQAAPLAVVAPFTLASVILNPPSVYGGSSTQGAVTLTGPAAPDVVVMLSSSDPEIASLPSSVTVPAGSRSASFSVDAQPVTTNTTVTISGALEETTQEASLTVLAPEDSVRITRAEFTVRMRQLRVEATSTNSTATLTVLATSTRQAIGTLIPRGGGRYDGLFGVPLNPENITLRSSLGGLTTSDVVAR